MSEIEKRESGEHEGVMLTIEQVARKLQIKEDTVYRHWRELGGFKAGGSIRFDWDHTRQRLLERAAQEEKASRVIPPVRRIPDRVKRKRRKDQGGALFERIPDRHGLWGDSPGRPGASGSKKSTAGERR